MFRAGFTNEIRVQFGYIRSGGVSAWLQRLRALALLALALPTVLLIRLIKPLAWIRFGHLWSDRIGHFALNNELYLCDRDASLHPRRAIDLFFCLTPICNKQLKTMWDRTLRTIPSSSFATMVYRVNGQLPRSQKHVVHTSDQDCRGLLIRSREHLFFTPDEERRGQAGLRAMGIPVESPFACFHVRDSAYLKAMHPDLNLSYHDYRNTSIKNLLPAVMALVDRGYYVLRFGALVEEELDVSHERIIDYAQNHRTDFLDIYLSARCSLFLGSGGGVNALPRLFRRPVILTNVIPLGTGTVYRQNDVLVDVPGRFFPKVFFLPKKLQLREDNRLMTFRETIDTGLNEALRTETYHTQGVEVIDNTPAEITAVTREACDSIAGTWQTTEEDEMLQRQFFSIFGLRDPDKTPVARIGKDFLRQHRGLLS